MMKKMDVKRVAAGFAGMMLAFASAEDAPTQPPAGPRTTALASSGTFTDASAFGFSSTSSGIENARALQQAVDKGGTITVSSPGIYPVSATVYLGSNTSLVFGHGVVLKKTPENGPFTHVFLNKGALTRVPDERISIEGLHIAVNGVDHAMKEVFGLRGQLAFFSTPATSASAISAASISDPPSSASMSIPSRTFSSRTPSSRANRGLSDMRNVTTKTALERQT